MAFVGDVILSARELMTDLPQSLAFPVINSISNAGSGSNNFVAGTYYVVVTQLNPWGESLPSPEKSIVLGSPANISVNVTANFVRIYFATSSGGQVYYSQFPITAGGGVFTFGTAVTGTQTPPTRSTAYIPDSDGAAVSAFAAYRWFNQALGWAAAKNRGGLPDFGAVGTINGQGNYVLPGYWKKIDSAWF